MLDDVTRIRHMIDACESVTDFLADREAKDLDEDKMLRFSVCYAIEIMGEAASKESPSCQDANPQIPWRTIKDMRNQISHAYFNVKTEFLWAAVKNHIPPLLPTLRAILTSIKKEEP